MVYTILENDLCHTKPEKVTKDILSYGQYLTDGVGIRNVVIGQLLRRQPCASRASYKADVVNVKRQLKSEAEKKAWNLFLGTSWFLDGPDLPGGGIGFILMLPPAT